MDAVAYIDGYNLYYGALKGQPTKWLDIQAFATALAPAPFNLVKVRYFTARAKPGAKSPSAHTDQAAYLSAIEAACPLVEIQYGHFLRHQVWAENVTPPPRMVQVFKNEEKGSDVNLAVALVNDAWSGLAKAALLISNDSDLAGAVQVAQAKGVDVYWFPPALNRRRYPSVELKRVVRHQRGIHAGLPAKCQLPNPVVAPGGAIHKPAGW